MSVGHERLTTDEVLQQVAEILPETDPDFIEHIANQVLGRKVRYLEEEGVFEYVVREDET
jgi:hypothetical protein